MRHSLSPRKAGNTSPRGFPQDIQTGGAPRSSEREAVVGLPAGAVPDALQKYWADDTAIRKNPERKELGRYGEHQPYPRQIEAPGQSASQGLKEQESGMQGLGVQGSRMQGPGLRTSSGGGKYIVDMIAKDLVHQKASVRSEAHGNTSRNCTSKKVEEAAVAVQREPKELGNSRQEPQLASSCCCPKKRIDEDTEREKLELGAINGTDKQEEASIVQSKDPKEKLTPQNDVSPKPRLHPLCCRRKDPPTPITQRGYLSPHLATSSER